MEDNENMSTSFVLLLGLAFLLFSLATAIHALLNKRDPKAALGWVACCLLVPYLGPFLYVVFGINRTRISARKMRPPPLEEPLLSDAPVLPEYDLFPLSIIGYNVTHRPLLPCEEVKVLINGDQAYPAMLDAIAAARETIYLATYIFSNGRISDQFLQALEQACIRGVDVKIILDGMGERMSFPRIGGQLKQRNIPFRRFNDFRLIPPSLHLNLRNHRKLLLVDGHTVFTGGMNIADENTSLDQDTPRRIEDIHFMFRGGIAADLEAAFLRDWDYCSGKEESALPEAVSLTARKLDPELVWARMVLDGPNEDLDKLSDILVGVISAAKRRIWIMTPYFLPDAELIGALQAARLRNVQVTILLPGKNNIPLTHWATRNLLWQLINYGVNVYYQPPPFVHSKLLLIDDYYSLVGSANIDPRSLRLNFELTVELFSTSLNHELEAYFLLKQQDSQRYTRHKLNSRPLPIRMRDAMAWLLSPYL